MLTVVRLLALLTWILSLTAPLGAHLFPVRFEQLSLDAGIPDVEIHDIRQDSRGFLWFSTRDGLGRFDGYEMVVHSHDPADPTSIHGNWVGPLVEDSRGLFWVMLGVGGMDRFDPMTGQFERIDLTPESAVVNDFTVTDAQEDLQGRMWVATGSTGLHRIEWVESTGEWAITAYRSSTTPGLDADFLGNIALDPAGRLWVATCGGGLSVVTDLDTTPRFEAVRQADGLSGECPTALHVDAVGGVWAGSAAGIDHLRHEGRSGIRTRPLPPLPRPDGGGATPVAFLDTDPSGQLWVGVSGHGLLRFDAGRGPRDGGGWTVFPFDEPDSGWALRRGANSQLRGNAVSSLDVDAHGAVWVSTWGSGVYRFDPAEGHLDRFHEDPADPHSLVSDAVRAGYLDRAGNFWFGTNASGVSLYSPWRWKFGGVRWNPLAEVEEGRRLDDRVGLVHPQVSSLAEIDGTLYVGTGAGVEAFDAHTGQTALVAGDRIPGFVNALVADRAGDLWVGTGIQGLFRYRPRDGSVVALPSTNDPTTPSSSAINTLASGLDPDTVWVGTSNGWVDRLTPSTATVERGVLRAINATGQTPAIWVIEEDPKGYLWVGTPGLGLFRVHLDSGEVRNYFFDPEDPTGLNNRTVNSLHIDQKGRLWVGTYSGGLDRYLPASDSFIHLTRREGLPSNMVESILEDGVGDLWLATRHGLASYDPDAGADSLQTFGRRDGLVVSAFSTGAALRTGAGELVFGGLGGLVHFDSGQLDSNPHRPSVVLTQLMIRDDDGHTHRPLDGVEEVVLQPTDRVFTLMFAALDFADPSRNQYSHRLLGFEESWSLPESSRQATYTQLDPGEYTFQVRGTSADGVWSASAASIRVRVLPPFWRTGWFQGLMALALVLATLAFDAWRRRQLVERERRHQERREHARKTRELDLARQVQRSLLPRGDYARDGLEVIGRLRTASEVGGDYFDVVEQSSGGLCVAIGDAIGHGMAAGLVVSMAKVGLAQALRDPEPKASEVLETLDALLREVVQPTDRRATGGAIPTAMGMGVALVDAGGRVDLASVAMPYPYLWRRATGRLEPQELGGLPLGRRRGDTPPSVRTTLDPGDFLILVSDGLAERQSPSGEPWGYGGLEAELELACGRATSAVDVAEGILAACDTHADGRPADDDLTVVVMGRQDE